MGKIFDNLYNDILKETATTTQPSSAAQAPQNPQNPQQQQQPNQNNQAYQKTPTPNITSPQQNNNADLLKIVQQKMQDGQDKEFNQQLLQMLQNLKLPNQAQIKRP
jgi:hypothetical protein